MEQMRSNTIIEELFNCGILHYVISPGLRSAPLAFAIYRTKYTQHIIHYDERGSGFFALGMAKAMQKPVCLLCTSGSALVNYYPAIVEASLSYIPLIILSSDRPFELRQSGSNQTIDQVKIFGRYLRFEEDVPFTDPHIPKCYFQKVATTAFRHSRDLSGPVLLNCMIRNPVESCTTSSSTTTKTERSLNKKYSTIHYPYSKTIPQDITSQTAHLFSQIKNGIILVGELPSTQSPAPICNLAQKLKWPILCDPLSGLRSMQHPSLIHYFPFILKTEAISEKPHLIIHFGNHLVSEKEIFPWLISAQPKFFYHVSHLSNNYDPTSQVTHRCEMNANTFCEQILPLLTEREINPWLQKWQKVAHEMCHTLSTFFQKDPSHFSEMQIIHALSQHFDLFFFFANSLPIRIANKMFFNKFHNKWLFGNRGASGIDGNIATAIGLAKSLHKPFCAVLGDQAFLHDINSLSLTKILNSPFILLLFNNHGGGIFHYRPDDRPLEFKEKFMINPQKFSFQKIAEFFGIHYISPQNILETIRALNTAVHKQVTIIELHSENYSCYRTEQALIQYINDAKIKNSSSPLPSI